MPKIFLLLTLLAALLGGCSWGAGDLDPHISGIIAAVENDSILIVDGLDPADLPFNPGVDSVNRAIWFKVTEDTALVDQGNNTLEISQLNPGMPAKAWHLGFTAESYPEQATGVKIIVTVK